MNNPRAIELPLPNGAEQLRIFGYRNLVETRLNAFERRERTDTRFYSILIVILGRVARGVF